MTGDEKQEPVTVVFRKYRDKEHDIIALFPEIDAGRGLVQSFVHVGQHGGADYEGVISRTVAATPEEYADLKRELEAYPYHYNLIVRKRRPGRI